MTVFPWMQQTPVVFSKQDVHAWFAGERRISEAFRLSCTMAQIPQMVCTARELCATTGSQCTAFHTQMAFGWWVQTL
jgi:hypothetical protein